MSRPVPEISDLDLAFPARAMEWLPPMNEIPEQFKNPNSKEKWNRLFNDAFCFGLSDLSLVPKDGINPAKAWRVVRACVGSFAPKHEHKEAGCAYLLSEWFDDAKWKRRAAQTATPSNAPSNADPHESTEK